MIPPSAAPPWDAQMFCWLALGDHEALKRDMNRVGILIPAEGKPTIPRRTEPCNRLSAAPPWEAQMLCWLTFGEHEAFKGDMKRGRILIPA